MPPRSPSARRARSAHLIAALCLKLRMPRENGVQAEVLRICLDDVMNVFMVYGFLLGCFCGCRCFCRVDCAWMSCERVIAPTLKSNRSSLTGEKNNPRV